MTPITARISLIAPSLASDSLPLRALLLCTLLLLSAAGAAAPVVAVDGAGETIELGGAVDLLLDPQRDLTVADVSDTSRRHGFHPAGRTDLSLDFRRGDYWLRFALHNPGDRHLSPALKIVPSHLAAVSVYEGADGTPLPQSKIASLLRQPILYSLSLPPQQTVTYHVQLHDTRPLLVSLDLSQWTSLLYDYRIALLANGLAIGAIAVLGGLNILFGCFAREKIYLYLGGYAAMVIMAMLAAWGFLDTEYVSTPLSGSLFVAFSLLSMALITQFSLEFGITRSSTSLGARLLRAEVALAALAAVLALALDHNTNAVLMWAVIIPGATLLLVCPLLLYFSNHDSLVLGYLAARLWNIVFNAAGHTAYRLELVDVETINALLLTGVSVELLILTGLLLVRSRRAILTRAREREYVGALEAENRAHAELLTHLNGRLRTPISSILGMTELLQNTRLSESQRDYVNTLQRTGKNLFRLLDEAGADVAQYSGVSQLSPSLFDLHALTNSCLQQFRRLAEESGTRLHCQIRDDVPVDFIGYPARLRQLLMQLLYAVVDTAGRDTVRLVVSPEKAKTGHLRFEISHGGAALSEDECAILSGDPAPRSFSRPGTNMRFALARHLVDSMNGRMHASNDAEGGSTITFSLKLEPVHEPGGKTAGALTGRTLLIADADPTFCKVMRQRAEAWGMAVQVAYTEQQALALLRNDLLLDTPLDVVLIDQDLGGNGINVAARLCRECLANNLPKPLCVLLTDDHPALSSATLVRAGIRRTLGKPATAYLLQRILMDELAEQAPMADGNR